MEKILERLTPMNGISALQNIFLQKKQENIL